MVTFIQPVIVMREQSIQIASDPGLISSLVLQSPIMRVLVCIIVIIDPIVSLDCVRGIGNKDETMYR